MRTVSEHILDELSWRGLIAQSTDIDALRRDLDSGPLTLYCGFDPTAPSLHAGNLVPLLGLSRFQKAGHRPIVLAGEATAMIGDPRDTGERPMNALDVLAEWTERIRGQLERFVDFDASPTGALIENNLTWTANMPVPTFLRDVGKHFSVNVMLARDTVKRRLEGDGMSYTEFSYLLLQSNDYLELYRKHGCTLQIGGQDQWGNIIGGVDLVRKVEQKSVHALTAPLVTDSQGRKFGKSTGGGNVWLDPAMTSPYAWYQYFVNVDDAEALKYLRMLTFVSREEIDELTLQTEEKPQMRAAQKRLAQVFTDLVHGEKETQQVIAASQALFGRGELRELDAGTLDAAMSEVPTGEVRLADQPTIIDVLVASGLVAGNGAARRTVSEGGAYVNNTRIAADDWRPTADDLLHGKWLVVRKGKRNMAGVRVSP
ncbi:tyrosyl-tRNA synthetase [Kibdelosporangium aridum]|uniref:Tyrosine--tRNA ligase n=1 Tax=Kibdelosporangium aridum TaxID=2030 RepID=A0A1W2FPR6_KIBAR|nr:tyrosyl-tRNA synthetase [Kibdelosporangium aridum]